MIVVTLASRRAVPPLPCVLAFAHPTTNPKAHELQLIQLHAQACTSLREALRQLQSPDISPSSWALATARTHRGLSALKQSSALANQAEG